MSGSHRASPNTIQIVRATVLRKAADIRRPRSFEYRVLNIPPNLIRATPSNSRSSKHSREPVKPDSELYSRQEDPTSSNHDKKTPTKRIIHIVIKRDIRKFKMLISLSLFSFWNIHLKINDSIPCNRLVLRLPGFYSFVVYSERSCC
jgi:hypothetical protein